MYASIKRLAIICTIASVINIGVLILFLMWLPSFKLGFSVEFVIAMLLITFSLICLLTTIGIHNLCAVLEMEYEISSGAIHELRKRVGILEEKCK